MTPKHTSKVEVSIKMDLKGIGLENVEQNHLALAFVNMEMKL
jgi:hypothetical protein